MITKYKKWIKISFTSNFAVFTQFSGSFSLRMENREKLGTYLNYQLDKISG